MESEAEFLQRYDPNRYPRPALTADALVMTPDFKKILLVRRGNHPFCGRMALPGGFVNERETAEEAAARELYEETGISPPLKQLYTVTTPGRDPRGWTVSVVFWGLSQEIELRAGDDAAAAFFTDLEVIRKNKSAFLYLGGSLSAHCEIDCRNGSFDFSNSKIIASDGLAFDHALLIIMAKMTICQNIA